MLNKVVLAYSGGLDTSVAIKWIKDKYNLDVIALTIDVGNERDFSAIRQKALNVGAVKALVLDAKKLFVDYFIFPALQADAVYEGQYSLATALSRPLMAKLLVDVALEEGASAVAHGCTGTGNDQVRFAVGVNALAPKLTIIAPSREWGLTREECDAYAVESQRKAGHAIETGRVANEIPPIEVTDASGAVVTFDRDEHCPPDTALDTLGALGTPSDEDDGRDRRQPRRVDHLPPPPHLGQRPLDELLAAPAGVHAHHDTLIQLRQN